MKHHEQHQIAKGLKAVVALMAMVLAATSCSMMEDDQSDCPQNLRVAFKYDMNMKFADAFPNEVKTVTLYAYDQDGRLALEKQDRVDNIIGRGGYMEVDELKPGNYTLKVWAEGDVRYADSYVFGKAQTRASEISVLTSRINRSERTISHDLTGLYHGLVANADLDLKGFGVKTVRVPLTKDTNVIRVVLQNASGKKLNADDFDFRIDDDNAFLAYDNSPITRAASVDGELPEDSITYRPWAKYDGIVGGTRVNEMRAEPVTPVTAVVAETTVNRLFVEKHPRLTVTNRLNGNTIFSIPLKDYVLLVKGNYNEKMTDQEYLDREDEYDFIFFIDDNHEWLNSSIFINSWRVVPPQDVDF